MAELQRLTVRQLRAVCAQISFGVHGHWYVPRSFGVHGHSLYTLGGRYRLLFGVFRIDIDPPCVDVSATPEALPQPFTRGHTCAHPTPSLCGVIA
jgi:hypothetical protein